MKLTSLIARLQIPDVEVHCVSCGKQLEIAAVLDSSKKIVIKVDLCKNCNWPQTEVF